MLNKSNSWRTLLYIALLSAIPFLILYHAYSREHGFLGLIHFGQEFKESALQKIKEVAPPRTSPMGYDGQFYAQISLSPALHDPALALALDNPVYRSRRIGLPLLAYGVGLGHPARILQMYALLNFFFWLMLLITLVFFTGFRKIKDLFLSAALLLSTGTLVSMARALTDFPAAVLGVLAVISARRWIFSSLLFALSGLIKETSVLSFAAIPGPERQPNALRRVLISGLIMVLPIVLWVFYVREFMPAGTTAGLNNFSLPFLSFAGKLWGAGITLSSHTGDPSPSQMVFLLFEFMCPLSLAVQAGYLISRPRLRSEAWRFGIGFVGLFAMLGESVWAEQFAYCRVLLPLTFAFNLLVYQNENAKRFVIWFFTGNAGMCYAALQILL